MTVGDAKLDLRPTPDIDDYHTRIEAFVAKSVPLLEADPPLAWNEGEDMGAAAPEGVGALAGSAFWRWDE